MVYTYLFKGADQLLLAQSQVSHGAHHTTGRCEEEQAWVQAGLACFWHQNNLSPGRDPLFFQHLDGFVLNLRFLHKYSTLYI